MNDNEMELLKSWLAQFRLDVIRAIAEIDVRIDALEKAVEEGNVVSPQRLKDLLSSNSLHHLDFRAQHIGSPIQ
jgi:hypothetical protein